MTVESARAGGTTPGDLHVVVMAGGRGERFWPASRGSRPKQFLPLGGGERSLFRETVERVLALCGPERVWVVAGTGHRADLGRELPEATDGRLLLEPRGRNTAPALGWAAQAVGRAAGPQAVLAALPSDHHIADGAGFRERLAAAAELARAGKVVTLGVTPTRPETGFGYIELDPSTSLPGGGRRVVRFVEKPKLEVARELVAGGRHLWNAGIFVFRADVMRALVSRWLPELGRGLERLDAGEPLSAVWETLPKIFESITA